MPAVRPIAAVVLTAAALGAGDVVASAHHDGDGGIVAAQAAPTASTSALFRGVLPRVARRTRVPILIPARVPAYVPASRLTGSGTGRARSYTLSLASAPNCGGATACFVGSFSGRRGGRPAYRRRVLLAGGRRGYYKPLTCGASCSPPAVQWMRGGVLYEISYAGASRSTEREVITGLANAAIRSRPR